jgi:hypothetical protein
MAGKKRQVITSFTMWPRPTFTNIVRTNKNFKSNLNAALLYAHYELSAIDLKKETTKYLKQLSADHPLLKKIKDMHENKFITVGKYMFILNHGGELPEEVMPKLMPALQKVIDEEERKEAAIIKQRKLEEKGGTPLNTVEQVPRSVISIQDRLREKAREVAGEVEGWIDDFCVNKKSTVKSVEDFVNLFKGAELKSPHMRYVRDIFENRVSEITQAAEGKDKDLIEAYSNFTKSELKKYAQFFQNLFKACDMMQEVAKVERAPRKKKPVSHEKIVAKLKFKKDDAALGIVSINPVQILGSKEVWLYNVKTRKLSQYKAADADGLTVKGASLLNFSADSVEKTVRKPAETLAEFKKASKVKLRTFLKDLSTLDIPCGGKVNEHHIILRADK